MPSPSTATQRYADAQEIGADPLFGQDDASIIGAPLLTLIATPDEESGLGLPQVRPTADFNQLTNEQRLRFLQQAQGALRFVEARLTDNAQAAADRQTCLDRVRGDTFQSTERGHRLMALEYALPSFRTYFDAYMAAVSFREDLESELPEDERLDISKYSGFEFLEWVMTFLLGLARAEARAIGVDLDAVMRGTRMHSSVPTGSPTAGMAE